MTAGLVIGDNDINDVIKGDAIENLTLDASTTNAGTISWSVKPDTTIPGGLVLEGGVISGTPTELGKNIVYLIATDGTISMYETIEFTVYSAVTSIDAETITSYGSIATSAEVMGQPEDLGTFTWSLAENYSFPTGFGFASSGSSVVTGSSTEKQETSVVIEGTPQNGPAQKATKTIIIKSEPVLTLTEGDDIMTWVGNTTDKTSTITASSGTTDITWNVSGYDGTGVSISGGVVTVDTPSVATALEGTTLTITAKTAYDQSKTVGINLTVEDILEITGETSLETFVGQTKSTSSFNVTGGAGNEYDILPDSTEFFTAAMSGNALQITPIKSSNKVSTDVVVTVTSNAGQTANITVAVTIYSALTFGDAPTNGMITYTLG